MTSTTSNERDRCVSHLYSRHHQQQLQTNDFNNTFDASSSSCIAIAQPILASPHLLQYAPDWFRSDSSSIHYILKNSTCTWRAFSCLAFYTGTYDDALIQAAVAINGRALRHVVAENNATTTVLLSREIVWTAVRQDGAALEYVGATWQDDRALVLEAVSNMGYSLEWASDRLRGDRDVVLAAMKQNVLAVQFASAAMLGFVSSSSSDDDDGLVLMSKAVRRNGWALQYGSARVRGDQQVVEAAVQQCGRALQFATPELQRDARLVRLAVEEDGCSLKYAAEELRKDRRIVLVAVAQNGFALRYASDELKTDATVVSTAVLGQHDGDHSPHQRHPTLTPLAWASPSLLVNAEFLSAVVMKVDSTKETRSFWRSSMSDPIRCHLQRILSECPSEASSGISVQGFIAKELFQLQYQKCCVCQTFPLPDDIIAQVLQFAGWGESKQAVEELVLWESFVHCVSKAMDAGWLDTVNRKQ